MWHSTHSLLILTCFSQRAFPTRENAQSDHARVAIYFAMQQEKNGLTHLTKPAGIMK